MLTYLSATALVPAAVAVGYGEPFWPFLAAGAIAGAVGFGLTRLGRRSPGPIGFREGYLVVSLTWLLAAMYGALPYLFSGEPQLVEPGRRALRGHVGLLDHRRDSRHRRRERSTSRCSSGASSASGSAAWGSSCSRSRCSPASGSAAGRCSSRSCPGPRSTSSPSGSATPRGGSGCSTSRLTLVLIGILVGDRGQRARRRAGALRGDRARAHHDAARRLLDRATARSSCSRRSRSG